MFDTLISGGIVVTAVDQSRSDVGITDGKIVAVGLGIGAGRREIRADGKYVLPGGIDSHCHIDQLMSGPASFSGDFISGTTAAAFGGNTTVICFTSQFKGKPLMPLVKEYRERAKHSLIDYSFHAIVTDPMEIVLREEIPNLISEGIRSIKIFSAYEHNFIDDEGILDVLSVAKSAGALVVVHSENYGMIKWLTKSLERRGLTLPKYHAQAKPAIVEREAISRVIALSEVLDQPIQIFHVSSAEGVDEVRRAQNRGVKVFAETCPQYLAFSAKDLDRPGFEGVKYLCSPALRTVADQQALWNAIGSGVIGIVSSDHAPWSYNDARGKRIAGDDAPFSKIPNGMPGIETRLPFLFSEGVSKGRISLQKFVAITSTNPAKLFGLYPEKGSIAPGMDADIAIWDPEIERTVRSADLHDGCDFTPFEGMELTGWPVMTLQRGEVITSGAEVLAKPGFGRFLARGPYDIGC